MKKIKEEKKEIKIDKRINLGEEEWKRIGRAFPTFSHWPYKMWKEWEKDCIDNFSNSRWSKAMHDHSISKLNYKLDAMFAMILELKKEVEMIKAKPKEEEKVKTLGGVQE